MAPAKGNNTSGEIRNTFYLTVIVVAAVLAGSVWISSAINLRRSSISYMMPVTGKAVSRSVARVVESRLSEARMRMLMARAEAAPTAKGEAAKAEAKRAPAPPSAEQLALTRIQKDPKARQKEPAETQGNEAQAAADTTPETYLIGRVTDERGQLIRQLAALIPVASVRKLEIPCGGTMEKDCLRGTAEDEKILRSAIVAATPEAEVGVVVKEWTRQVSSDVAVEKAWKRVGLPGTADGFLLQALAGVVVTKPNALPEEIGADMENAIARQMAADVAFVTLPAIEADWAARDISARLAWGTATVIFVGLWAAVASLAVYSIWNFTKSKKAVAAAVGAAAAAALLVALAQYARPSSFELFGQLLRMLEVDRDTRVAAASRVLTCLVAASLVLLLAASRAILRPAPAQALRENAAAPAPGQDGESAVIKADLAKRLTAFRSLFNTGALLLAAAALEVATLYSWPGSVFDGASEAPASLKAAALLGGGFAGALFSIVLVLVYVPTQSVLQDWVRRDLPDTGTDLLNEAGLNDTTSQQFLRLLQAAAPMLAGLPVSGLISLLD